MDKIRTIKIKNLDGSISEESYTISVAAKDVDMDNGKDLQDTIGEINIDTDGSIAEQLEALKKTELHKTDIIDNLESLDAEKMLSAKQGKILKDDIDLLATVAEDTYATKVNLTNESNARSLADETLQTNITTEINNRRSDIAALTTQIGSVASGSPLIANSISDMTDTTRVYVNVTDGYWYYYNGTTWTQGGIYQASAINENDPVITNIQSQLDTIYTTDKSINYFNLADMEIGGIKGDGTIYSGDAVWKSYRTTNYIKVKAGDVYKVYFIPASQYNNRCMYCLFNNSKEVLSYYNQESLEPHVINISQDGYMRCSVSINSFNKAMLTKGAEVSSVYVPYYFYQYINLPRDTGKINQEEIETRYLDATPRYSVQLPIDFTKCVVGYLNIEGEIEVGTSGDRYRTTDYFSVKKGFKYVFPMKIRKFLFCDKDKIIKYFQDIEPMATYEYIAPSNGYIRFSYLTVDEPNIVVNIERNELPNKKLENGSYLSDTMKQQVEDMMTSQTQYMHNVLTGKKWWSCGDSFTAWTTEEFNQDDYPNITDEVYIPGEEHHFKTYPFWIGTRNQMIVHNYGKNGQTLATPSSGGITNAFTNNLYTQIPSDVDYITIQLGINDSHNRTGNDQIPLGTITDETVNTFYGAWNVVLPYLIEHHPFAHIGVIVSNGCETSEYAQATIECCRKWGIPFIDLNGDDKTPFMIRSTNPNIESSIKIKRNISQAADYANNNLQPNAAAHLYESYFIENFLKSI